MKIEDFLDSALQEPSSTQIEQQLEMLLSGRFTLKDIQDIEQQLTQQNQELMKSSSKARASFVHIKQIAASIQQQVKTDVATARETYKQLVSECDKIHQGSLIYVHAMLLKDQMALLIDKYDFGRQLADFKKSVAIISQHLKRGTIQDCKQALEQLKNTPQIDQAQYNALLTKIVTKTKQLAQVAHGK